MKEGSLSDEMRARHHYDRHYVVYKDQNEVPTCDECGQPFPCDASKLIKEMEPRALAAKLRALSET